MFKRQNGITLIALIITIIVMLILVGVTINVALNGGLFDKAEEATTKTKISQIQEALAIKEGEILADNDGVVEGYTLTLADLDLPEKIKNEFSGKLIIGTDGKLYYDERVVTDTAEQNLYKSMGIQPYKKTPPPPSGLKLKEYFFNEDGTGKTGLMNQDGNGVVTFVDDPDTIAKASEDIEMGTIVMQDVIYMTVSYQGADYKVEIENIEGRYSKSIC